MKLKKSLATAMALSILFSGFLTSSSAMKPSGMRPPSHGSRSTHTPPRTERCFPGLGRVPVLKQHSTYAPRTERCFPELSCGIPVLDSATILGPMRHGIITTTPIISGPFIIYHYSIEEAVAYVRSTNPETPFSKKPLSFLLKNNPNAKSVTIFTLNPSCITKEGWLAIPVNQVIDWYNFNHILSKYPESILVFDLTNLNLIYPDPLLISSLSPLRNHPFFLSCKYDSRVREQLVSRYNYSAITFDYAMRSPLIQFTMFTPIRS